MCTWSSHSRDRCIAGIHCAYTQIPRILHDKEEACWSSGKYSPQPFQTRTQILQARAIPNNTPVTKSQSVMQTIIEIMVTYSALIKDI